MEAKEMTRRLVRAIENPWIDIISHLTGRLLKERPACALEIEKIFVAAKKSGAVLEINAQPRRLDLNALHIRGAVAHGVKLAINTDAHRLNELDFAKFGIGLARAGWAAAEDIINTRPWDNAKKFLKRNQKQVN
jgi:DNA polymerase (family 10)